MLSSRVKKRMWVQQARLLGWGPGEREKGRICGRKEMERVLGSHLLVRRLGDILFMAPVCRAPVRRTLDGQDQVPGEKINLTDTQQE